MLYDWQLAFLVSILYTFSYVPLPLYQATEQYMRHRLDPPTASEILCKTAGANEVQICLQKS